MTYESSSSVYDNLRDVIFSLGMEISDSILLSLRDAVAACRQENQDRMTIVEPVLMGFDAVINHIDAVRAVSDPDAFRLLNELLAAYQKITDDSLKAAQEQQFAFTALKQVLDWQHLCMLQPKRKAVQEPVQEWESVPEPVVEPFVESIAEPVETISFDLQAILNTVQQEVAETSRMAARESALLCDLTHVKEKVMAKEKGMAFTPLADGDSAAILANEFDAMREIFQEEMIKLRQEMGLTAATTC